MTKITEEQVREAKILNQQYSIDKVAQMLNVNANTLRGRLYRLDIIPTRQFVGNGGISTEALQKNAIILRQAKNIFSGIEKGQAIDFVARRTSSNGKKLKYIKGHGIVIAKDDRKFTVKEDNRHTPESFTYNDLIDRTVKVG